MLLLVLQICFESLGLRSVSPWRDTAQLGGADSQTRESRKGLTGLRTHR